MQLATAWTKCLHLHLPVLLPQLWQHRAPQSHQGGKQHGLRQSQTRTTPKNTQGTQWFSAVGQLRAPLRPVSAGRAAQAGEQPAQPRLLPGLQTLLKGPGGSTYGDKFPSSLSAASPCRRMLAPAAGTAPCPPSPCYTAAAHSRQENAALLSPSGPSVLLTLPSKGKSRSQAACAGSSTGFTWQWHRRPHSISPWSTERLKP